MITPFFKDIKSQIINEINQCSATIKIAVAWFTNDAIFEALIARCTENKIHVQLIIIGDSINIKALGLDFNRLIAVGGELYFSDSNILMHHKFCVIDDKTLINGSYNWTYWAESKNNENIIVFHDEIAVVEKFSAEFENIISKSNPVSSVNPSLGYSSRSSSQVNINVLRDLEYSGKASYLISENNLEEASNIFSLLSPPLKNEMLKQGIGNEGEQRKKIYQYLTRKDFSNTSKKEYEHYCSGAYQLIRNGHYIEAILLSNECTYFYRHKFSIHVYCGDAKSQIGDSEGAKDEYQKALMFRHTKGNKILYFNKPYNYPYFPRASVYLKLNDKLMAIDTLKKAVVFYRSIGNSASASQAENYIRKIENNETIYRIE